MSTNIAAVVVVDKPGTAQTSNPGLGTVKRVHRLLKLAAEIVNATG